MRCMLCRVMLIRMQGSMVLQGFTTRQDRIGARGLPYLAVCDGPCAAVGALWRSPAPLHACASMRSRPSSSSGAGAGAPGLARFRHWLCVVQLAVQLAVQLFGPFLFAYLFCTAHAQGVSTCIARWPSTLVV